MKNKSNPLPLILAACAVALIAGGLIVFAGGKRPLEKVQENPTTPQPPAPIIPPAPPAVV